jgi:hypothetical protein
MFSTTLWQAGDLAKSFEYGIAPLMIAAVVPMHSLAAEEFAQMIGNSLSDSGRSVAARATEPAPVLADVA